MCDIPVLSHLDVTDFVWVLKKPMHKEFDRVWTEFNINIACSWSIPIGDNNNHYFFSFENSSSQVISSVRILVKASIILVEFSWRPEFICEECLLAILILKSFDALTEKVTYLFAPDGLMILSESNFLSLSSIGFVYSSLMIEFIWIFGNLSWSLPTMLIKTKAYLLTCVLFKNVRIFEFFSNTSLKVSQWLLN